MSQTNQITKNLAHSCGVFNPDGIDAADNCHSDIHLLVRLIRKCVFEDREDDAVNIFNSSDPIPYLKGADLLVWAHTAELLGKTDKARVAYEKALADPDCEAHALEALARMALECGNQRESERLLAAACSKGISPTVISKIKADMVAAAEDEPEFEPVPLRDMLREQAVQKMLVLFQGKRGVHARQWYDRSRDQCGYVPVEEPLTCELIEKHLDGAITLGVYPLLDDNTVCFAAIDIDVRKASLHEFCDDPAYRAQIFSEIKSYIIEVKAWSEARRLPVVFEYSGMKGIHAWYFFEKPMPAGCALALLQDCVNSIKKLPPDLHVEIFPRQEAQSGKGFGNLIKLPLGVHRKTGKRSVFLDDTGAVVSDGLSFILKVQRIAVPIVEELTQAWRDALKAEKIKHLSPLVGKEPKHNTVLSHPVIENCAVINWLVKKAETERHLTFVERKVLLGVLGHIENGKELLHKIISNCSDYSADITDHYISKLKGTPLGCNRIRRLLFYLEEVVECRCTFSEDSEYASPINHLNNVAASDVSGDPSASYALSSLAEEVAKLRAEIDSLKKSLRGWELGR